MKKPIRTLPWIREWLDSQDFYEVCYAYRTAFREKPKMVAKEFENLKDAIEAKFIDLTGKTMDQNELTKELASPKQEAIVTIGVISLGIETMYKEVERHETHLLGVLNRLHGINYPYPYTRIDRDFYDAYKALRDLKGKLQEVLTAISGK